MALYRPRLGANSGTGATQAGQSANNYTSNQNTSKRSITSLFGRAGYSYNDKYYFDLRSATMDHRNFTDSPLGFFSIISGCIPISEENFMRSYKDNYGDLKLRASYGILGDPKRERLCLYDNMHCTRQTGMDLTMSLLGVNFT